MPLPQSAGENWYDASVSPITVGRHVVRLLLIALHFYSRHKAHIDPHLSDDIIRSLELLVASEPFLVLLNVPGPQ